VSGSEQIWQGSYREIRLEEVVKAASTAGAVGGGVSKLKEEEWKKVLLARAGVWFVFLRLKDGSCPRVPE